MKKEHGDFSGFAPGNADDVFVRVARQWAAQPDQVRGWTFLGFGPDGFGIFPCAGDHGAVPLTGQQLDVLMDEAMSVLVLRDDGVDLCAPGVAPGDADSSAFRSDDAFIRRWVADGRPVDFCPGNIGQWPGKSPDEGDRIRRIRRRVEDALRKGKAEDLIQVAVKLGVSLT